MRKAWDVPRGLNPSVYRRINRALSPFFRWLNSIKKGYINSICGFSRPWQPVFSTDRFLLSRYSSKLRTMMQSNNYNYNPDNFVYSEEILWLTGQSEHFTRDLSVAAWMESSVYAATKHIRDTEYNRNKAEAIDYDHVVHKYYNWRLYRYKPYYGQHGRAEYKIKRYEI